MRLQTPFGVRDLLPEDTEKRAAYTQLLHSLFESHQYQHIQTTTIEFWDNISHALDEKLQKQCITFFDSKSTQLVLRPDHTTPIARIVANRLASKPKPIKLYYLDSVFRRKPTHGESEIFQAGIECIGNDINDADIIALCIETLEKLGLKDIGIDIGSPDFSNTLSDDQNQALRNQNYVEFGRIPTRGGLSFIKGNPNLETLYQDCESRGIAQYIQFNEGLTTDTNYYSGIFFECHVKGYGKSIGYGGRYDTLLSKFGFDCPAIGFALDMDKIEEVLS